MSRYLRRGAAGFALLLAIVSAAPGRAQTQIHTGTLDDADGRMPSGEFVEDVQIQPPAGQTLVVTLVSLDFDPFLIVNPPEGNPVDNDDFQGAKDVAQVVVPNATEGAWTVRVTSFEPGESGQYALLWRAVPADQADRTQRKQQEGTLNLAELETDGTMAAAEAIRVFEGQLAEGDKRLPSTEWFDLYVVEAAAGETLTFDMDSEAFDTYLAVASPTGEVSENDDDGQTINSLVEVQVSAPGRWFAIATSAAPLLQGSYTLTVTRTN